MTFVIEQPRAAVSVDELKRAWQAVQAGAYRCQPGLDPQLISAPPRLDETRSWQPHEAVVPVVGCTGSAGATTLAVSLATVVASDGPGARVVECCTVTASGLAAAATAELGKHPTGWVHGSREKVLLERGSDVFTSPSEVPAPTTATPATGVTVLDVGWELGQLVATPCWLADQVRTASSVIAVTTATIPGLRRLEAALALLEGCTVFAAVLGPPRRKWPRTFTHSLGVLARQLDDRGSIHTIPLDRALAQRGLDSHDMPDPLLKVAADLIQAVGVGATTKENQ